MFSFIFSLLLHLRKAAGIIFILMSLRVGNLTARELILAADPWCPYTCEVGSGRPGFMVELVDEALKLGGLQLKYVNMSWSRAIEEARKGRIDGVIGALRTDAPDFVFPSVEVSKQTTCLFVRKGFAWTFKGLSSLETLRLGGVQGYSYGEALDAYIQAQSSNSKRLDLISGEGVTQKMIKKLVAKRIDVMLEDLQVAQYYFKSDKSIQSEVEKVEQKTCMDSMPLYVAFSPKNKDSQKIANALSEGLKKLQSRGISRQISLKYGL